MIRGSDWAWSRSPGAALAIGAGASLALLLAHAWWYRFLTDDAFISFRYARNLAQGHGLVFNPGFERVEGYTNFLWVILLAIFARVGAPPERVANALSVVCGVAIWWLVLRSSLRKGRPIWLVLAPVLLLASTRSFAVWCTGGLESKFFEFLVFAGVLRAVSEVESARSGRRETWAGSSLLLGLACLARPDRVVIAAGLFATRCIVERRRGRARLPVVARGLALAAGVVAAHVVFRLSYYGDWLPNTYYAKVGGRTWWSMGFAYATSFALEYGIVFWLPLLAVTAVDAIRGGTDGVRAALFAGTVLPYLIFVVAIGGDHFEYRPLDLLFPFAYLLLADGASVLYAKAWWSKAAALGLLLLVLGNAVAIPLLTHLSFPEDYRAGFPGGACRDDGSRDLVSADRFPALFKVPLVGRVFDTYNDLVRKTTAHAVGIRQEEHKRFLSIVIEEGRTLARLVSDGLIPTSTHIAIGAVGAIPYVTGLRTLDRLGLTDRIVARSPGRPTEVRRMAHDKDATISYAIEQRVDLWSADLSHLIVPPDSPRFSAFAAAEADLGIPLVAGWGGPHRVVLAYAAQGLEETASRLLFLEDAAAFFQRLASDADRPWWAPANVGDLLAARGRWREAVAAYHQALEVNPFAARTERRLGALLVRMGRVDEGRAHLERSLAVDPSSPEALVELSLAMDLQGRDDQAHNVLLKAVDVAPDDVVIALSLARFLLSCADPAFRNGDEAVRIAERLRRETRGWDPEVLDTLGTAYASVGRFTDAQDVAREAIRVAARQRRYRLVEQFERRADAYARGRMWFGTGAGAGAAPGGSAVGRIPVRSTPEG